MSFKSLETRYKEKVNQLYAGAKTKFDDGRPSNGANDDPLIVRRPGDGYFGGASRALGRSLPLSSATQDVKRLTLFTVSTRGITFLLKQQLLQTGNTFEQTRLINPVFAVGAALAPGLGNIIRIRRHLRPITGGPGGSLLGKTDTSDANVRKLGQLQKSTYDNLTTVAGGGFGAFLKKLAGPLTSTISAFTAKKNIGEEFGNWNEASWLKSRPELFEGGKISNLQFQLLAYQEKFSREQYEAGATNKYNIRFASSQFDSSDSILGGELGVDTPASFIAKRTDNIDGDGIGSGVLPNSGRGKYGKISYIRDPLNDENLGPAIGIDKDIILPSYNKLSYGVGPDQIDAIYVSFAMGNDRHVQFRAFIKDIQQTANPQYKDYQYIGRIEKFISYISVQREVSFKLGILAFSEEELDIVWTRINYLTGMVFPYGINRGILQPNIIRMNIGNLYVDQPAYITGLTTVFNEPSETWDIGVNKQVPISAQMDMRFTLIEKRSVSAASPFYGITELNPAFSNPPTKNPNESVITDDSPENSVRESINNSGGVVEMQRRANRILTGRP